MKKKYFLGIQLCYVVTGILIIGSTIRNNIGYSIGDTVLAEKIEEQYAVRENDIQNTGVVPSGTDVKTSGSSVVKTESRSFS